MVNGISHGSTNSNGKLTLTGNALTSGANTFNLRNGTNNDSGTVLATSIITPISLTNLQVIANDTVINGDTLPISAKMSANVTDKSGYSLVFSGAVTGTYITDKNGQVTVYYEANGSGDKTVTVTGGTWTASDTFTDYLQYWNTIDNFEEQTAYNQGFTKLAQYYKLDTQIKGLGVLCIGKSSEGLEDWELTFKIINPVSDVYFDIFSWQGTSQSQTFSNMDLTRQVSFNANDIIKARLEGGTLTVTKNNQSFFTKSFEQNTAPALLVRTDTANSVVNVSGGTVPVDTKVLTFNELRLKGI